MNSSVVVAIIGGVVSLLGIWLNHYLAIKREFLFRGLSPEPHVAPEPPVTQLRERHVESRRILLKAWYRALFAIAISPIVNLVISILSFDWCRGYFSSHSFFLRLSYELNLRMSFILALVSWFYASCIIILFPLLVLFYRRVTRPRDRLIFAVVIWYIHSAALFLIASLLSGGLDSEDQDAMIFVSIGGAISGLVYWLITDKRSQRSTV